jgi:hypothetical protein
MSQYTYFHLQKLRTVLVTAILILAGLYPSCAFAGASCQITLNITICEKCIVCVTPTDPITIEKAPPGFEMLTTIGVTVKSNTPWSLYFELRTDNPETASQGVFQARTEYEDSEWTEVRPNGRSLLLQSHKLGESIFDVSFRISTPNGVTTPFTVTPIITITSP